MCFYDAWKNPEKDQICFTTELVSGGTLKEFFGGEGIKLKLKVVKKWCRQILSALAYLHSLSPPIIHRDLKCDNIFINGNNGEIRIGDFGLSSTLKGPTAQSVLGTPEFMAPELYEEKYSELVDIYAFGMCVLEIITKQYPWQECHNAAQIWKAVSNGKKPKALYKIQDDEVRCFVELCLSEESIRPTAQDLLDHPFLVPNHARDMKVVEVSNREVSPTILQFYADGRRQRDSLDRARHRRNRSSSLGTKNSAEGRRQQNSSDREKHKHSRNISDMSVDRSLSDDEDFSHGESRSQSRNSDRGSEYSESENSFRSSYTEQQSGLVDTSQGGDSDGDGDGGSQTTNGSPGPTSQDDSPQGMHVTSP